MDGTKVPGPYIKGDVCAGVPIEVGAPLVGALFGPPRLFRGDPGGLRLASGAPTRGCPLHQSRRGCPFPAVARLFRGDPRGVHLASGAPTRVCPYTNPGGDALFRRCRDYSGATQGVAPGIGGTHKGCPYTNPRRGCPFSGGGAIIQGRPRGVAPGIGGTHKGVPPTPIQAGMPFFRRWRDYSGATQGGCTWNRGHPLGVPLHQSRRGYPQGCPYESSHGTTRASPSTTGTPRSGLYRSTAHITGFWRM